MIRERCETCGESHPAGAAHLCASGPSKPPAENDNHDDAGPLPEPPSGHFDEKAWKKNYMREYMRRKRERKRREKGQEPEGMAG